MNTAIKLDSLYATATNSTLELNFDELMQRFGVKEKEKSSDAFLAGIKQMTAVISQDEINNLINNNHDDMYSIEITEVK